MKLMKRRDERSKVLSETFAGIKAIKLYAWETPFSETILKIRELELALSLQCMIAIAVLQALSLVTPVVIAISAFVCFTLTGGKLTPEMAFPTLSLLQMLAVCIYIYMCVCVCMYICITHTIYIGQSIKLTNMYVDII